MDTRANNNIPRARAATFRRLLLGASLLCALAAALFALHFHRSNAQVEDKLLEDLERRTQAAAEEIDRVALEAQEATNWVASALQGRKLTSAPRSIPGTCRELSTPPKIKEVEKCLKRWVGKNKNFYGASITYRPNPETKSVYFFESGSKVKRSTIPEEYATSKERSYRWYADPMRTGLGGWSPPYYDPAGKAMMITHSSPFRQDEEGKRPSTGEPPTGVVTIDITSARIEALMRDLDLGRSGYPALTNADGIYLYHPNSEYLQKSLSLKEVGERTNDPDRLTMWRDLKAGRSGALPHTSVTTGERTWLVYAPLASSGWGLQNTFLQTDLVRDQDTLRHDLMGLAATLGLCLFLLLWLWGHDRSSMTRHYWRLSLAASALLAAQVGIVWFLSLRHPPQHEGQRSSRSEEAAGPTGSDSTRDCGKNQPLVLGRGAPPLTLTEGETLKGLVADYETQAECQLSPEPIFVQVGTSIESLRFVGPGEVQLGGYVWLRAPKGAPKNLDLDFSIAHAVSFEKTPLFDEKTVKKNLRRYKFEATISQARTTARYPIERSPIVIEFRNDQGPFLDNKGKAKRAYLVPALGDYHVTAPGARPGLHQDLVVPGWKPLESHFSLSYPWSGSNLGLQESAATLIPPALRFNILLQRDFADAFISNLTPIIVVAIMLFALLTVSATMDYGRALSICMGMFFVIVFSHIDVRRRIGAQEIFYLEYFYFAIYAGILAVSFACLLSAFKRKLDFIERNHRLVLKTLYWPSLLGSLYLRTLLSFY